jgi:hypothetical protein
MGAEVTGYALAPPTNPSLFDIARKKWGQVFKFELVGYLCII